MVEEEKALSIQLVQTADYPKAIFSGKQLISWQALRYSRAGACYEYCRITTGASGTGTECGFQTAELLSPVPLVLAGCHQGYLP